MGSRDGGPRSASGDGGQHRRVRASIPLPLLRIPASSDGDGDRAFRRARSPTRSEDRRRVSRQPEEPLGRMIDETWNLEPDWKMDERWAGIIRPYGPEDVVRLRGTIRIRHTLAERGAGRLWSLLKSEDYVPALGALTGNQAIQQVRARSEERRVGKECRSRWS